MIVCQHCKTELIWYDKQGYLHLGGGLYVVYCHQCGWRSDKAEDQRCTRCPACGGDRIWDDHVALPVYI